EGGVVYINYDSKNEITEKIPAKSLLATCPILLEIYNYQNDVTLETKLEKRIDKVEYIPRRMQLMVIDYLEVNHSAVGMQLIENMFSTGKRPPSALLTALVNIMLQSKDRFRSRDAQRTHWTQCKQAYTLLIDVLTLFGPAIYNPIWNEFLYFDIPCDAQQNEDMEDESSQYELLNIKELSAYRDIWDYIDKTLNESNSYLDSKCQVLVLDFFVNVLQTDLKEKLGNENKVASSIFFNSLSSGSFMSCTKFEKYLDILLKHYPHNNGHLCQLAGNLLNMLITISCFDGISNLESLVNQLYSRFQKMEPETCAQLMQAIQYPTFLIGLLDKALADTDVSNVDKEYKKYRLFRHKPLRLEKVLFYVLSTLPNTNDIEALYRHTLVVSKYCMSVFSTASVIHKQDSQETNSALDQEQFMLLIEHQNEALDKWEKMLEERLDELKTADLKIVEKIRWSIKLTRLTILEYL
ncbi:hypothetical protein CU098_009551, partial [Rhizopus stolonifer]